MTYLEASATISPCGLYRYDLRRVWDRDRQSWCLFVMLNPSTADGDQDDPTIRRCVGFADRWGFGGLVVVNLFALRATDPDRLYSALDAVGPDNNDAILKWAAGTAKAVAAWGNHGRHLGRGAYVRRLIREAGFPLHHLGLTNTQQPKHPLYLKGDTEPVAWPIEPAAPQPGA